MKKFLLILIITIFIFSCGYREPIILATGRIVSASYISTIWVKQTIITFQNGQIVVIPQIINIPDKMNTYTLYFKQNRRNHDFDMYYFQSTP